MSVSNTVNKLVAGNEVTGEFVTMADERYYAIRDVDKMAPFFISLVSDSDHWMFISSNGGLTAGRVSPETALFPYITVDRIYESTPHTGSRTLFRVEQGGQTVSWEPFNKEQDGHYAITRNLYKNTLGNKVMFEEINHDLQLTFRYNWVTTDQYGFSRRCELQNMGSQSRSIELLDGMQNILPAGTPRFTQTNSSYLVDAYKWSELEETSGLALFTLFSGITDRAEPCESLKATTVFCLGFDGPQSEQQQILLSSDQLDTFRNGGAVQQERHKRGVRGAYWINNSITLAPQSSKHWQMVINVEQSQTESVSLQQQLKKPAELTAALEESIAEGSNALAAIMAAGDGFQLTAEENVSVHHYANAQFNILRGGIFDNQYQISSADFRGSLGQLNAKVSERHRDLLESLPAQVHVSTLLTTLAQAQDPQLTRLSYEYLPITFGRRHGDPSRPWNQFEIKLRDDWGNRLLSYQGNWRDIFQNWEALLLSYPEFTESVIAKFVNASTIDGYNPYRITKEGIDWEVEEPDDPWSYIGYWGDHQIIYLLKLLEISQQFHPQRLEQLLCQPIFCYANVPYKIKPFADLVEDAKSTVFYDDDLAELIEQRVEELGADGKLLLAGDGEVYQVNLLEKLLVPLLSKLGNLVIDGGIWLNTQRPEWNDANNALVGQGLSMVTLYYMRRYIKFMQPLLATQANAIDLSNEVGQWLAETATALKQVRTELGNGPISAELRYQTLEQLGEAASRYREAVYSQQAFTGTTAQDIPAVCAMLDDALAAIDHSIQSNLQDDGMYHAYNVLDIQPQAVTVENLYPMLEGQVAALSSGAIAPAEAVRLMDALFDSDIFREDQNTFLLYPDRDLPGFLQKNCLPSGQVEALPLLMQLLADNDTTIIEQDAAGTYRFNAQLTNVNDLEESLDSLASGYAEMSDAAREPIKALYEQVFNHKAFTGRSGGMFGFEGLGSIYWHMVSKLLLAVQENFFSARAALEADSSEENTRICQRLGSLYYRVREGIGFNKTPAEYGAFPTDPYSHTPKHIGAQQPGMTGQVKEELIARFAELGVRVANGAVQFDPCLLRACEFISQPQSFRYMDVDDQWQEITVPTNGLAFSWCQVPLIYQLTDTEDASLVVVLENGEHQTLPGLALPAAMAEQLFVRNGRIRQLHLLLPKSYLFID